MNVWSGWLEVEGDSLSKTLAASLGSAQFIENFLQSLSVSPVNNTLTEVWLSRMCIILHLHI